MTHHPSRALPGDPPLRALVDGRWDALGGRTFPVTDPFDGTELAWVTDAGPADVAAAMEGAWAGFSAWRSTSARERADALRRAHDLLLERREELATLISTEMGKALPDSRAEVEYAAGFLREYAERAPRIEGRHAVHEQHGGRFVTQPQPVGPCVVVTPWNFPLAMGARKLAPALAAGCSVVVKPPDSTPLTMLALAGILLEAGVHPSAVSVLPTTDPVEVVRALIAHPRTAKLSFTGSTVVGRELARQGGEALLRMSMELGGNAPFLVFEDADLEAALQAARIAKFRNGGQACTSANRFLVHDSVADAFVAGLVRLADAFVLGRGTDVATTLGPMIDDRALGKVRELVGDAVRRGAVVRAGGDDRAVGRLYPATVLSDVPADARIMREEVFGPVAPVVTFSSEAEAVRLANDTEYGLVAYAFTRDAARCERLSRDLDVGMVGMNTGLVSNPAAPFGGVKGSGFGREGGPEGLEEYLQTRYVALPAAVA
jgi:succinate-semialdehyde dehydrogenase/glutarate-semialdehyde dehydrogenase